MTSQIVGKFQVRSPRGQTRIVVCFEEQTEISNLKSNIKKYTGTGLINCEFEDSNDPVKRIGDTFEDLSSGDTYTLIK